MEGQPKSSQFLRPYVGKNNLLSGLLGLDGAPSAKDIELVLRGKYHLKDKNKDKPSGGNRVRVGGKEMSEEEYLKGGSYRDKARAEQERLGRKGRGHDLRGGGGQKEDGSFRQTPNVPEITSTYTAPAAPAPQRDNMANASELERYRVWVGANEGLAKKVKPGQAGYEEIQQILGNTGSASPATIQGAAEDAGRTKEDMGAIMNGGLETVFEPGKDPVSTPLTGRNTSAPNQGDIPQSGTAMGGVSLLGGSITPAMTRDYFAQNQGGFGLKESDIRNSFSSVALPTTQDAEGQFKMVKGGIQTPSGQVMEVDDFYGAVNNVADNLDQTRALGFIQDPGGVNFQFRRTK